MAEPATCPVTLKTDGFTVCDQPVKRNGLCGTHARSADLATARDRETQNLQHELYRQQQQLTLLGVQCRVVGYRIVLTHPEALIKRMRTIQIMRAD